jgi:hypothetical protein
MSFVDNHPDAASIMERESFDFTPHVLAPVQEVSSSEGSDSDREALNKLEGLVERHAGTSQVWTRDTIDSILSKYDFTPNLDERAITCPTFPGGFSGLVLEIPERSVTDTAGRPDMPSLLIQVEAPSMSEISDGPSGQDQIVASTDIKHEGIGYRLEKSGELPQHAVHQPEPSSAAIPTTSSTYIDTKTLSKEAKAQAEDTKGNDNTSKSAQDNEPSTPNLTKMTGLLQNLESCLERMDEILSEHPPLCDSSPREANPSPSMSPTTAPSKIEEIDMKTTDSATSADAAEENSEPDITEQVSTKMPNRIGQGFAAAIDGDMGAETVLTAALCAMMGVVLFAG